MYTECDEIADTLRLDYELVRYPHEMTMDDARKYVRTKMPDESYQVIDNVAYAIIHGG